MQDVHPPSAGMRPAEPTLGIPELEPFATAHLITGIYACLPSGKEATVYCCRGHPSTRCKFLAAKIYRRHVPSAYRRSGPYYEGRERALKPRIRRAIEGGGAFGRAELDALWVSSEYRYLKRLHARGADVPRPIAHSGPAILMEYIGNGIGPAPALHGVSPDPQMARQVLQQIVDNIMLFLRDHTVHGDLSPYNILMWKERPVIIDFPQAVDARFNRNAFSLLERDLVHLASYFVTLGVHFDPRELAAELWRRYRRATL